MRKLFTIVAGASLAATLSACAHNGLNRARPDEFAVARQAPLVIPPDYSLSPPQPGAPRPQDVSPRQPGAGRDLRRLGAAQRRRECDARCGRTHVGRSGRALVGRQPGHQCHR